MKIYYSPLNYMPWEVPRIFNPNISLLSNVSSSTDDHWTLSPTWSSTWTPPTKDDELERLFEGTSDKSLGKWSKIPTPISPASTTLGAVAKIQSPELTSTPKTTNSITAVSLTPKETAQPVNIIENKVDKSRTLNSLETRINVFPVDS